MHQFGSEFERVEFNGHLGVGVTKRSNDEEQCFRIAVDLLELQCVLNRVDLYPMSLLVGIVFNFLGTELCKSTDNNLAYFVNHV